MQWFASVVAMSIGAVLGVGGRIVFEKVHQMTAYEQGFDDGRLFEQQRQERALVHTSSPKKRKPASMRAKKAKGDV